MFEIDVKAEYYYYDGILYSDLQDIHDKYIDDYAEEFVLDDDFSDFVTNEEEDAIPVEGWQIVDWLNGLV